MTEHGCGCGCGGSHDNNKECKCGYHHSCGDKYSHFKEEEGCLCEEKFLMLADEAWKEYLKERIKAKIAEKKGQHIEDLAEIISTANGERWKHKIMAKMKCHEFKENIKHLFESCGQ